MDDDRNLLFAVLALQADLLDQRKFAEACTIWSSQKLKPMADLLVERGWLTADGRAEVQNLLERKLAKHKGDAKAAFAGITTDEIRQTLDQIGDPDIRRTFSGTTLMPHGHVLVSAIDHTSDAKDKYTLNRLHATGGIGRVWLARDASLGREVALKELRPERAGQPVVWARFLKEAKITGQLEHPGIVPVYEVGRREDDKSPFYTMRFVRGRTLDDASRAYHERKARGEAGPLELRELLTAFVGVCNAVAYAHSRGVIHRDLKPQNIVLGDYGEVIVLDWGLARVLDEAEGDSAATAVELDENSSADSRTVAGQVMGTPAFMAPEQAAGRLDLLDARTDVYGLGAVLYAVLSGRPPFEGPDTLTVLRRVIENPPKPLHDIVPGIPLALEAVCLKALAKRPGERYASAKDLVAEINHFLADEPVTAYREPLAARAGRWARQHRTLVAAAAAALLAILGGLGAVLGVQARANRNLAGKNAELAASNERERQRFDLAMDAVGAFHTGASEDVLLKQQEFEPLRKKLLESAADFYRKLQAQLGNAADSRSREALARSYSALGDMDKDVGATDQALRDYEQGRNLYEKLAADAPSDPAPREELVKLLVNVANVYQFRNEMDLMKKTAGQAVSVGEQLVASAPGDPERSYLLALSLNTLNNANPNSPDEKERLARRAAGLMERVAAEHPEVPEYQRYLGSVLGALANVAFAKGHFEESVKLNARAAEILEKLRLTNPSDLKIRRSLAITYGNKGLADSQLGEVEDALADSRRSSQVLEEMTNEQPAVIEYQQLLSGQYQDMTWALWQLNRRDEAIEMARKRNALLGTLASRHPDRADLRSMQALALMNTGLTLLPGGRADEALRDYLQSEALLEALVKAHPAEADYRGLLANVYSAIGHLYQDTGRAGAATMEYEHARDAVDVLVKDQPADLNFRISQAYCWKVLGANLGEVGKYTESLAALKHAQVLAEKIAAEQPNDPSQRGLIAAIHQEISIVLRDSGDEAGSLAEVERALAIYEKLAFDLPKAVGYRGEVAFTLNIIGLAYQRTGRFTEARAALERCREIWEQLAAEVPKQLSYRDNLGRAIANLGYLEGLAGNQAAALQLNQRAVAIREKVVAEAHGNTEFQRGLSYSLTYLGQTYRRMGQREPAGAALERSLTLVEPLLNIGTEVSLVQELHLETRLELGMLRLAEGRQEVAANHFAQAIKAAAKHADPSVDELVFLVGIHAQLSRLPDTVVKSALAGGPDAGVVAKEQADEAMALLNRAVEKSFGDVTLLTRSDAYDPLRDREDFRKLLKTLQDKTNAPTN
ncbi:MAG TPA: tetratricopeptide repeat protein [Candidatus Acidoferrales bacterium]|nr:tetratricopeptide repeat protein [Candidatus Acidoferrales bacterium]